ncbi:MULTISPECIES: EF-hand domain-containing protein [Cupriavidus]|uniref:EF-hand domain-containing protein n=1 Tax=Cupriavidus sp. DF5525 TaxID=3160989 RepID=UPI0032DF83BB
MIARQLSLAGLALAACFASGTIGAQQQPMNPKEAMAKFSEKFKAADANHDGKLTRDEAQAGMPEVYKQFDLIDTKKKGEVTERQVGAYWAAKAKQRGAAQNPGGLN